MGKKSPLVDAYIGKSADFARPILKHLRRLVHEACPDAEEAIKWGHPNFLYKGMFCGMASFKQHCVFGFWKSSLVLDEKGRRADEAMGSFGRLTTLSDLPPDKKLVGYIRRAAELNDLGVRARKNVSKGKRPALKTPADLVAALKRNQNARATFEAFSPTNKRDYVEWIIEAKTEETRKKRLETSVAWMAEGKTRNWKYVRP